jgi:hypothetical protein
MRKAATAVGIALVMVVLLGALTLPVDGQASRTRFDWVLVDRLTVGTAGATVNGDLSATGDFAVTGDSTLTGDLTTSADASFADTLNIAAQTSVTMTQSGTLTPTGSYQPITAAGNLSFGDITAGTAGGVLTLINLSNTTITITDTGTLKLSGNAALSQYDALILWSDGTNWVEVSQADN